MLHFSILIAAALPCAVQDTLVEAAVVADRDIVVSRTDTVSIKWAADATSALTLFPSLLQGDCGGLAGLKSVSLRGLGSAHTAIYLDGVRISNLSSGQADLGMLPMENIGRITVDYAQNSVSFTTPRPVFGKVEGSRAGADQDIKDGRTRTARGTVRLRGGSFGTWEPFARLDLRTGKKTCLSISAAGIFSRGDFPYIQKRADGSSPETGGGQAGKGGQADSPAGQLRRSGNDIRQGRGALDLWGSMDDGSWHVKACCNASDRGTPGSVDWPSTDRQKDLNALLQGVLDKRFSSRHSLNASAKAAYDDIAYSSSYGDSRYRQGEVQASAADRFRPAAWCSLSAAAHLQWDALWASGFNASRIGTVASVAAVFTTGRFRAELAARYSVDFDRCGSTDPYAGTGSPDGRWTPRHCLSPSLELGYTPLKGLDISAFARRAQRVPIFNELYYTGYGNPQLRAEDAWLSGLGVRWSRKIMQSWTLQAGADAFCNVLKDKIMSAPTEEDPNIWLPYNIGRALMAGADLQAGAVYGQGAWKASFTARYAFLDATDRTPEGGSYGQALPYVARHSANLDASMSWRGWGLGLQWNIREGRRDSYGPMPGWNTLDLTAGKEFNFGRGLALALKFYARNLTDSRYELSGGYPMPGRSFLGGAEFKF